MDSQPGHVVGHRECGDRVKCAGTAGLADRERRCDPEIPTDVTTSTSVTLTWPAPTSDGGARLTGYQVQRWSSTGWEIISSGLVAVEVVGNTYTDGTYVDMDVDS